MMTSEQQKFAIILMLVMALLIISRDTHKLFAETPRTWMRYGQNAFYAASALLFAAIAAGGGKKAIAAYKAKGRDGHKGRIGGGGGGGFDWASLPEQPEDNDEPSPLMIPAPVRFTKPRPSNQTIHSLEM